METKEMTWEELHNKEDLYGLDFGNKASFMAIAQVFTQLVEESPLILPSFIFGLCVNTPEKIPELLGNIDRPTKLAELISEYIDEATAEQLAATIKQAVFKGEDDE